MAQKDPNDSTSKSTAVAEQSNPHHDPWKVSLSALVDAYPKDFILQYIIVPTALHIWLTLAGIAALAFFHYRVCHEFGSTERVCSSRTHYVFFAVECSLVAMTGYTYYLKLKFVEEQGRSLSRRK